MTMEWRLPRPKALEYGKPPSAWIVVAIFVVAYVAGFVLTVLTWESGRPVMSADFFVRVLVVPLMVGGGLGACVYCDHEAWIDYVEIWAGLRGQCQSAWHAWAQGRIAILGCVTLTPERDLAERMLGLEGSEPQNAGKHLALSVHGRAEPDDEGEIAVATASRFEGVLESIIEPFTSQILRFADRHTFSIIVQSELDDAVDEVRARLRRLNLTRPERVTVERATERLDASLIHQWLNKGKMPDFCLLLACQLHQDGQAPQYSEAAVGMLFTSIDVLGRYREELRPKAYVFQPISAATDSVADAMRDMLEARQVPLERIGHLWLSALRRQGNHATVAAASAAGLNVAVHDVEMATGLPGPANALLTHALAAEMVEHGQGTQLIATSGGAGVLLSMIGARVAPVPVAPDVTPRYLRFSALLRNACFCVLLELFLTATHAPGGLHFVSPALFAGLIAFEVLAGWRRCDDAEDAFYGRTS